MYPDFDVQYQIAASHEIAPNHLAMTKYKFSRGFDIQEASGRWTVSESASWVLKIKKFKKTCTSPTVRTISVFIAFPVTRQYIELLIK